MSPLNYRSAFLSMRPALRTHWRRAGLAIAGGLALTAALVPFAGLPLPQVDAFLPMVQSTVIVMQLVIAAMLFGQFTILRARPLLALVALYVFGAAMVGLHLLSFPGLFAPMGLLGGGPQTTAWLYFSWRIVQALTIIAYALLRWHARSPVRVGSEWCAGAGAVCLPLAIAALLAWATTAGHGSLPEIMAGSADLPRKYLLAGLSVALTFAGLVAVAWQRRHTLLDIWLIVAVCVWICEIALESVFNAGRFSVGWYAGRMLGLPATASLLVALVLNDRQTHQRLIEMGEAEAELRRLSDERLARREDDRKAIARGLHEDVAQSLAALKMMLHALRERTAARDPVASAQIEGASKAADSALSSVRRLVAELRPPALDQLGIAPALDSLVSRIATERGLHCELTVAPTGAALDEPHATAVFRIVEELLASEAGQPPRGFATRVEVDVGPRFVDVRVAPFARQAAGMQALDQVRERALTLGGQVTTGFDPVSGWPTARVALPLKTHTADSGFTPLQP